METTNTNALTDFFSTFWGFLKKQLHIFLQYRQIIIQITNLQYFVSAIFCCFYIVAFLTRGTCACQKNCNAQSFLGEKNRVSSTTRMIHNTVSNKLINTAKQSRNTKFS